GFKVGDVVLEFNGKPIINSSALPPLVGVTAVGKEVPVLVIRDGKRITLATVVAELPAEESLAAVEPKSAPALGNQLNIDVSNLTKEQRDQLQISDKGVVVTNVDSGPASHAGIRTGDVILKLNNEAIKDVKHFERVVEALPTEKNIAVLIQRSSGPVFLALKITKEEKENKEDKEGKEK
ncbi:MAG: mucD, partial [Halothiobacillaceae bacterium]